jgi:hypothetical protein
MVLFYHNKATPASGLLRKLALATLSVLPLRLKSRQKGNASNEKKFGALLAPKQNMY